MNSAVAKQPDVIPIAERCVLCGCRLTSAYHIERGLCGSCSDRPEAKRLPRDANGRPTPVARPQFGKLGIPTARAFTVADQALIRNTHGYLPAAQLLRILNERLQADLGAAAPLYTLEQLHAALKACAPPTAPDNWTGLRQVLAAARASGVLDVITMQTVEDFAVVWQLSPGQLVHLKDVIAHAKGNP